MANSNDRIDRLQNSFACAISWDAMSGNARKRYCLECRKHVYDFSQLTQREITALLEASHGNLCARITRNQDGSIQTQIQPEPTLQLISRRASPLTNAVVSAALSLTPVIAYGAFDLAPQAATVQTTQAAKKPALSGEATASVRGTIVDPAEAMIAGALITLRNDATGASLVCQSTDNGDYAFDNLPAGTYSLTAEMRGFKKVMFAEITLQAGDQKIIPLRLEVAGEMVTMGVMAVAVRPLRVLHEQSEVIVEATIGKSVVAEVEGETKWMKTALHINSQLKGESTKNVIDWYHAVYDEEEPEFQVGDQVLFFLNARKEGKAGYELSDYRRSSKKLSAAELQSYASRIRELANLTNNRKPALSEIVEWLVQCAQDPATRWEGASDLLELQSTRQAACEKNQASQPLPLPKDVGQLLQALAKPTTADTDQVENDRKEENPLSNELLTPAQKDRLTNTLLSIEKLNGEDYELLRLVTTWETKRVIPYLLAQLHQIEMRPSSEAQELLTTLAEIMNDEKVKKLADEYNEQAGYADEEVQVEPLTPEEKERLKDAALLDPIKRRQRLQYFLRVVEDTLRANPPAIR